MVSRIKTVCESFVSRPQVGFVPERAIGKATLLLKLIQAYLDETEEEGLILALGWEKFFDRCSWDYVHFAFKALNLDNTSFRISPQCQTNIRPQCAK